MSVNVGTTRLGTNVLHTITVQNTGQSHLELSDLNVVGTLINNYGLTNGFSSVSPGFAATSVPPGGSTTFQVKLNASTLGTNVGTTSFKTNDIVAPEYNFGLTGLVQQPVPTIIDNGGAGYAPGAFATGPRPEGYQFDADYASGSGGAATATATWTFSGLADGQYQVAATWVPDIDRATAAPYTINGGTPILINQTLSPNDFAANQYHNQIPAPPWAILGTVTVSGGGGVITVTLSNANVPINQLVGADAIRIVRAEPNVVTTDTNFALINNGDPGYSCAPNCNLSVLSVNPGATPAFNEEVHSMAADGTGDTATWNFDLEQGTYEIAVAWSPGADRTTTANYKINGGAAIVVNQTNLATPGIVVDGKPFQIINGSFTVTALSKSVTITLSDVLEAGRIVIADAVVVRRTGGLPLLAAGSPGAGSDASAIVTAADLGVLVAAAADRWEAAGVSGSQLAFLRNAKVVISDMSENRLGMANAVDGVITVDVNAAGFGWFIDQTPGSDEEFAASQHAGEQLAVSGRGAGGRIDLLTVLIHEMGHLVGLPDLAGDSHDSMAGSLAAGLRRSLTVSPVVAEGHTNAANALDVNNDGGVSPVDALIIINELNTNGSQALVGSAAAGAYFDTNGDGYISSLDALLVINELNSRLSAGEGEGLASASLDSGRVAVIPVGTNRLDEAAEDSADSYFASLGDEAADESQVFPVADLAASVIDRADPLRVTELDDLFAALAVE